MRIFFASLLTLFLVLPGASAHAEEMAGPPVWGQGWANGCMTSFYLNIDIGGSCIQSVIRIPNAASNPAVVGFLAGVFISDARKTNQIITLDVSPAVQQLFVEALYVAGLLTDDKNAEKDSSFRDIVKSMKANRIVPLKQNKPSINATDNDMLIGAYMATGNTYYITSILDNFSGASDDMVRDSLRLAMMHSKFGGTSAPRGSNTTMMQAACEKYECKKAMPDLLRVLTLSSAFWALDSLSGQDVGVKKTLTGFFESDTRLKRLHAIESNAFANYLTTLALYSAIKDNPNFNSSLSIYEKLGSGEDAIAAMRGKKN